MKRKNMNNKLNAFLLERTILGSKTFARLRHIFMIIDPSKIKTDTVQSRDTHSIEVANAIDIMNFNISSKLGFNVDMYELARCIGLLHDYGHFTFGHVAEIEADSYLVKNFPDLKIRYDSNSNNYVKIKKDGILDIIKDEKVKAYVLASLAKHPEEIYSDILNEDYFEDYKSKKDLPFGNSLMGFKTGPAKKIGLSKYIEDSIRDEIEYFNSFTEVSSLVFRNNMAKKTVQCQIMDVADEIAYTFSDINDSFNILEHRIIEKLLNELKEDFLNYFKNEIFFNNLIKSLNNKTDFRKLLDELYFLMCSNFSIDSNMRLYAVDKNLNTLKLNLQKKFQKTLLNNELVVKMRKEQARNIRIICDFMFNEITKDNYKEYVGSKYYIEKFELCFNNKNGQSAFIKIMRDYIANMTTKGAKKILKKILEQV